MRVLAILCLLVTAPVSAAAAQGMSGPQFVRLVQAYRLRQFQQSTQPAIATQPPALDIRAFSAPSSQPALSRRLHLELPGQVRLSLGGRLTAYGASTSLRLRVPFGLIVP